MIKYILSLLFFLSPYTVYSQEFTRTQLDSILNVYTSLRETIPTENLVKKIEDEPSFRKCGTGLVSQIKNNLEYYSDDQQLFISKILDRPVLPNSFLSPGGFFRIHYSNSGTDAVQYDINLLALALDSAYKYEVNYLGYLPPPADGTGGGDSKYDVYVRNLGNLYGQTSSEANVGVSKWTSYMEIDNDFAGFYTQGINAARVTAAHEFHHAIQMGNYAPQTGGSAIRNNDIFFYEITSTAMEEFVFDTVNDYYAYMPSYFRSPDTPLPLNNGYNLAIWNLYLKELFGFEVLKRQWELITTVRAMDAINRSILEAGSTLGSTFNLFGIWTHYTNSRSINGKYFQEASNYPLIIPTAEVNFPYTGSQMFMGPAANYFFRIYLPGGDGTFITVISNSDVSKAIDNPNQVIDFSYSMFNDNSTGERMISDEYSVTFSRENQLNWNNSGILNNIIVYTDSNTAASDIEKELFVYPSPFRYSVSGEKGITIVFESDKLTRNEIDFYVYSSSLDLVYSDVASVVNSYTKDTNRYFEITWDVVDNAKKEIASGIYFFVIKIDSDIKTGKLAVFND